MKYDFAIIGSGIIGLTLAFKLKQKFNNSKIAIFEKCCDTHFKSSQHPFKITPN